MLKKLAMAEHMEEVAEQIYRRLAEGFEGGTEGAVLFGRLADEEHQHLLRVRMVRSRYMREDPALTSVHLEMGAAEKVIRAGERMYEELAKNAPRTLEAARALALELEDGMTVAHAEMLTRECSGDLRTFLENLADQDRHHARLLKRGAQTS